MRIAQLTSRQRFSLLLLLYAVGLFSLLPRLSLWLDEILDLKAVRDYDLAALLAYIPMNAGAVPLGYLAQFAVIRVFGYSTFSGRLPSAVFSLIACAGLFVLGRHLKHPFPIRGVLIFCLLPLQLRYALEARPYSQALALTIWSTVAFCCLADKPVLARTVTYSLLVLASLYTQPYTLFVPMSHLLWACFVATRCRRRLAILTAVAILFAASGFLPWYVRANQLWGNALAIQGNTEHGIALRAVRMVARELVGAGYAGTALIVCAAVLSMRGGSFSYEIKWFLVLSTILPIVFAVLADAQLGYFLAIRQMLWVLAPLSLLSADGIAHPRRGRREVVRIGCCLMFAILLFEDVRLFVKPRENWEAASKILQQLTARGVCVVFLPGDSATLYGFFAPDLPEHSCPADIQQQRAIALAVSPYRAANVAGVVTKLSGDGFQETAEFNPRGPQIEVYERHTNHN